MDTETVTLISGIATFVTALAALGAILEMKRQRISSYKPELVLMPFMLRFEPSSGFPPLMCRRKDDALVVPATEVGIDCVNVGAGTARDLVAAWSFDREAAVVEISPFVTFRGYELWTDTEDSRIDISEGDQQRLRLIGTEGSYGKPYLLAPSAPDDVFRVPLPHDYLFFLRFGIYCLPGHPSNEGHHIALPRLPPLCLTLDYTDVGGARRRRVYKVQTKFSIVKTNLESDGSSSLGEAEAVVTVQAQRRIQPTLVWTR